MYSPPLHFFLLATTLFAASEQSAKRICPIRQCDSCLDPSLQSSPGVAFHLGLTSGAVAVSYNDGHVDGIVHIPGSPEYIALMQDFSTNPDRLNHPPLDTLAQRLKFLQKKLKRRSNLLLGRPGTQNAATLSSLLTDLRSAAEPHIADLNHTFGVAFANGALASLEEVNDALSHAGMTKLGKWQVPDQELNAAYGAYGFGLCSTYTDPYKCEEEESAFEDSDVVLHIDYTSKTLSANTGQISTARSTYATKEFVDWKLGRDEVAEIADEKTYWNSVKKRIEDFGRRARKPFSRLLLTGDCAKDPRFLKVVKDALRGSQLADQVEVRNKEMDLTFAVARGAAEFQRRRQQGWLDCVQPKYCSEDTFWRKAAARAQQALEL